MTVQRSADEADHSPAQGGLDDASPRPAGAGGVEGAGRKPWRRGKSGERPRRRWKWTRRLLATGIAFFVLVTSFSFIYNAATAERAREPAGLRFVSADGIRTRYSAWGVNGPPIVLVHGAAESSDTWAPVAERLAARYRVYAFDVSGWGYSERRGPFDAEHGAAQLIGVMDALRLPRATLVGHSSGAGIVAAAALRAPGRVGGLVFVDGDALDTGAGAGADDVRGIVRNPYRTTLLRLGVRSDWVIRKIYGSQCGPACPRLDRAGVDRWRRPFQVAGAESALWRMEGVVGLPERRVGELSRLNVPKSVVFGADDDVFSRSAPYDTARLIGAPAPTIVPDARHLPIVSHPDRVATAISALPAR